MSFCAILNIKLIDHLLFYDSWAMVRVFSIRRCHAKHSMIINTKHWRYVLEVTRDMEILVEKAYEWSLVPGSSWFVLHLSLDRTLPVCRSWDHSRWKSLILPQFLNRICIEPQLSDLVSCEMRYCICAHVADDTNHNHLRSSIKGGWKDRIY